MALVFLALSVITYEQAQESTQGSTWNLYLTAFFCLIVAIGILIFGDPYRKED